MKLKQHPKFSRENQRILYAFRLIASAAKELNVGGFVSAALGKRFDVIEMCAFAKLNATVGALAFLQQHQARKVSDRYSSAEAFRSAIGINGLSPNPDFLGICRGIGYTASHKLLWILLVVFALFGAFSFHIVPVISPVYFLLLLAVGGSPSHSTRIDSFLVAQVLFGVRNLLARLYSVLVRLIIGAGFLTLSLSAVFIGSRHYCDYSGLITHG